MQDINQDYADARSALKGTVNAFNDSISSVSDSTDISEDALRIEIGTDGDISKNYEEVRDLLEDKGYNGGNAFAKQAFEAMYNIAASDMWLDMANESRNLVDPSTGEINAFQKSTASGHIGRANGEIDEANTRIDDLI